MPDGVGVALGEEPQVAVELHLLQRHRPAGQPAVLHDRGEEGESLAPEQFGHLARLVVSHGFPLPTVGLVRHHVPGAQPGDQQVQAVLEGRRERPGEPLVDGGEHDRLVGQRLRAPGVQLLVRRVGQRLGRRPLRLGLPLGGAADDVRPDREQRLLRLPRRHPGRATSSPSTRSIPAKLSGLGRLPASTRGASRVATSASNIRWASARSHSHQGWPCSGPS